MYVSIISLVSDHAAGYHCQMLESIIRSQDPVSIHHYPPTHYSRQFWNSKNGGKYPANVVIFFHNVCNIFCTIENVYCNKLSEVVRLDCEPPIGQLETKRLTKDLLISGGAPLLWPAGGTLATAHHPRKWRFQIIRVFCIIKVSEEIFWFLYSFPDKISLI